MTASAPRNGWLRGLAGAALAFVLALGTTGARADVVAVADVETTPITAFLVSEPDRTDFGPLQWLGGLQVTDPKGALGTLSDVYSHDAGRSLLMVGDEGTWVSIRLKQDERGQPLGIEAASVAPLLAGDMPARRSKDWLDSEGLAIRRTAAGYEAYVSLEARNRVLAFRPLARPEDAMTAVGQPVPALPAGIATLRYTKGMEALAAAPDTSPLRGGLVAISEEPRRGEADHAGFIIGGARPGTFSFVRRDDFDVTSAAFLPGGDLLVLERRFTLFGGPAMRLLRVRGGDIVPGARVDGKDLLFANIAHNIDNMEGLAIDTAPDGSTILTIVSDDNRSVLQRTLILRFKLLDTTP